MDITSITLKELQAVVADIMPKGKIAAGYTPSFNDTTLALNKIGKQWILPQMYENRLSSFIKETLPLGQTVEELFKKLAGLYDYDRTGAKALKPFDPDFMPAVYSYTLPEKVIPVTTRVSEYQSACISDEAYNRLVADIAKSDMDATNVYEYALGRELLARAVQLCEDTHASSVPTFATKTAYKKGDLVKSGSTFARVISDIPATNSATFDNLLGKSLIALIFSEVVAKPTDDVTAENFFIKIKECEEVASDISEGHSLNGCTIGTTRGSLKLYVKQGILPAADVKARAGTFNLQYINPETDIIVVKDFGDLDENIYAILADERGLALFPSVDYVMSNSNGEGGFYTNFHHLKFTAAVSTATYIHYFKAA